MNSDVLAELQEAETEVQAAQQKAEKLRAELHSYKGLLRGKLTVGKQIPCKIARLGDELYAVNVWVRSGYIFHIVELTELEE